MYKKNITSSPTLATRNSEWPIIVSCIARHESSATANSSHYNKITGKNCPAVASLRNGKPSTGGYSCLRKSSARETDYDRVVNSRDEIGKLYTVTSTVITNSTKRKNLIVERDNNCLQGKWGHYWAANNPRCYTTPWKKALPRSVRKGLTSTSVHSTPLSRVLHFSQNHRVNKTRREAVFILSGVASRSALTMPLRFHFSGYELFFLSTMINI